MSKAAPWRGDNPVSGLEAGDPIRRLLKWVEIVTRPVADGGPANDEVCRVDARDLYHLAQAAEAYTASSGAAAADTDAQTQGAQSPDDTKKVSMHHSAQSPDGDMRADADLILRALDYGGDYLPTANVRDGAKAAVSRLLGSLTDARRGQRPIPSDEGGPGHEETYWLRAKLNSAVQHLRDVEDYYRLLGGLPEGFNMIRADRARDLYEAITEDFVNGKISRPTRVDLEAALADAQRERDEARAELRDLALHLNECERASDGPNVIDELLAVYMAVKARCGFSCDVVDEARALAIKADRAEAAEARVETLQAALSEIAAAERWSDSGNRGGRTVYDIARAALREQHRETPPPAAGGSGDKPT